MGLKAPEAVHMSGTAESYTVQADALRWLVVRQGPAANRPLWASHRPASTQRSSVQLPNGGLQ